jgi:hypothetical protein
LIFISKSLVLFMGTGSGSMLILHSYGQSSFSILWSIQRKPEGRIKVR